MKKCTGCSLRTGILFFCGLLLYSSLSYTQGEEVEAGRAIGKVSTNRDVIVMEFDDSALGKTNLFDLVGHTRRFSLVRSVPAIAPTVDRLLGDDNWTPRVHDYEPTLSLNEHQKRTR
jgi:hypothetical protein